jgi:hypothetical protein
MQHLVNTPMEQVYKAMDEYAKQCLGMATTLLRRAYELNHDDMGFDIDVTEFFDRLGKNF